MLITSQPAQLMPPPPHPIRILLPTGRPRPPGRPSQASTGKVCSCCLPCPSLAMSSTKFLPPSAFTIVAARLLYTSPVLTATKKPAKKNVKNTADRNPLRGRSATHRRGLQEPLNVEKYGLPEPVDSERRTKLVTAESHGLWGFFREKTALPTPENDHKHGACVLNINQLDSRSYVAHANSLRSQGARGALRNCVTSRGTICTGYGGSASRSRIFWRHRNWSASV